MRSHGVLQSWKQIANYIGRTERTLQRWEREFGFPIHRPSGKARSAVMALASEIQRWTRGKPSLVEIRRSERLAREKFVNSNSSSDVGYDQAQAGGRDAAGLSAPLQQAITVEQQPSLFTLRENLANLHKELRDQKVLCEDLANL